MNPLPAGVQIEQIHEAVSASGYPLQTILERVLRGSFFVTPEWTYIDKDTRAVRNMDLFATKALFDWESQPRVRTWLTLLIEAKKSDLPYLFFETILGTTLDIEVAGLPHHEIDVSTGDDPSHWIESFARALGLDGEDFLNAAPAHASTFARVNRSGSKLTLSGDEIFNNTVLPLMKASDFFLEARKPRPTQAYWDANLVIRVCVVDAPILVFRQTSERAEPVDWVRVLRQEVPIRPHEVRARPIDFVHRSHLDHYLANVVLPFAGRFADGITKHEFEVVTGRGHVAESSMIYNDFAANLRPVPRIGSLRYSAPILLARHLVNETRSHFRNPILIGRHFVDEIRRHYLSRK